MPTRNESPGAEEPLWGFPPLQSTLRLIASLDETQFEGLRAAVSALDGFNQPLKFSETLGQSIGIPARQMFQVLAGIEYLYDRARAWTPDGLRDFFRLTGLDSQLGQSSERTFARVLRLVEPNPEIEHRKKLKWLQTGILETATSFASLVDLRPNFTADRSALTEFVPVIIFRISTDSDTEDNGDFFQLTEDGLGKLKEAIGDVEKKLATLRNDASLSGRIYSPAAVDKDHR